MSVTNGTSLNALSYDELKAELDRVKGLLAKKNAPPALHFKIGEKGGICVIGLQRFPVTLYWDSWCRLIEVIPGLQAFAKKNAHLLKMKPIDE